MREYTANSLAELRALFSKMDSEFHFCFRGQSDGSWGLVPTVFRGIQLPLQEERAQDIHRLERDCHREFRDECIDQDHGIVDTLDWLAFEQHHGAPTRLLDWTHQIAVAAFFAASGSPGQDAAVFAFNLSVFPFDSKLGRQHPNGGFDLERIRHYCSGYEPVFAEAASNRAESSRGEGDAVPEPTYVVWRPARRYSRLRRQSGLASLYLSFSALDFELDLLHHFKNIEDASGLEFLSKVTLPKDAKQVFRKELEDEGVDEFSIYGGLDNLGKRVTRAHCRRLDQIESGGREEK